MEPHNSSSPSFINIFVLLLFAVVIAVASSVGTYFLMSSRSNEQPTVTQPPIVPPAQTNLYPTAYPTTQTTVPADETANWKSLKMSDVNRFGYEVKIPPNWSILNKGFVEGGDNPVELTASFERKSCEPQLRDYISINYFFHQNPTSFVASSVKNFRENGFTISSIKTGDGIFVEKMSGKPPDFSLKDLYVFIPTTKGYYDIKARAQCRSDVEQIFDQMLSTFKFLK